MTHREQFIAMLQEARIDFGYSDGDSVIAHGCRLQFYADGRLRDIHTEGGDYDDFD